MKCLARLRGSAQRAKNDGVKYVLFPSVYHYHADFVVWYWQQRMLLEIVGSLKLAGSSTSILKGKVVPLSMSSLTKTQSHDPTATITSESSNPPAAASGDDDTDLTCRPLRSSRMAYSDDVPRAAEVLSTEDAMALLKSSLHECMGAITGVLVSINQIDDSGI